MNLIGQKFKRNVYGLSTWTDEITSVWYEYDIRYIRGEIYYFPRTMIKGKSTGANFPLEEIILLTIDLNPIQKLQEDKFLISEYIQSGKIDEVLKNKIKERGIKFGNPLNE